MDIDDNTYARHLRDFSYRRAETRPATKPAHLLELTRYRAGGYGGMVPSDAGPWVSYADVQTLLAALALRTEAVRR